MMYMIILAVMFMNSFLFTQMKHPMSMGIILLSQTMLTCLMTGLTSKSFWFSYILFLVFIGGMLILFMYMSSIASNEKINFSTHASTKMLLMMAFLTSICMISDKFFFTNLILNEEFTSILQLIKENSLSISKMYNYPNNMITILLISYLLLTLIMVVKITNNFIGPLRPMLN